MTSLCLLCSGSGEGIYDGIKCQCCGGIGTIEVDENDSQYHDDDDNDYQDQDN